MLGAERKEEILKSLEERGKVTVSELALTFGVTMETIRRDLDQMYLDNKLIKVHGGAIAIKNRTYEPPFNDRMNIHKMEKKKVARETVNYIMDNDVIAIDVGTSTVEIINHIYDKKNLTIIINSVCSLNMLIEKKNQGEFTGRIIFLGGEISTRQMTSFGPLVEKQIEDFFIDKSFIAVGGLSIRGGITTADINEGAFAQKLISKSNEVFVVADHSKIGVNALYKIAGLDSIHKIICDTSAPEEWSDKLDKMGVEWIIAK